MSVLWALIVAMRMPSVLIPREDIRVVVDQVTKEEEWSVRVSEYIHFVIQVHFENIVFYAIIIIIIL